MHQESAREHVRQDKVHSAFCTVKYLFLFKLLCPSLLSHTSLKQGLLQCSPSPKQASPASEQSSIVSSPGSFVEQSLLSLTWLYRSWGLKTTLYTTVVQTCCDCLGLGQKSSSPLKKKKLLSYNIEKAIFDNPVGSGESCSSSNGHIWCCHSAKKCKFRRVRTLLFWWLALFLPHTLFQCKGVFFWSVLSKEFSP